MILCNHGYFLADCAICEKRDGECDYGSCEADASGRVVFIRLNRVVDSRPCCNAHIGAMTCAGAIPDDLRVEVRS